MLGDLTSAMALVLREPVQLVGAGRTDAGVHAWGQVVSADLPEGTDLAGLVRRINKLCPGVSLRDPEWADPTFDARFSATSRSYRYHVWNSAEPNPLLAAISWHISTDLDIAAMQDAGMALLGEHDFGSFCRRQKVPVGATEPSLVRRVYAANWMRYDESAMLRFDITGSAFCHQMVRSIVGTLVDVGRGQLSASQMPEIIQSRNRSTAGTVAPPFGLILWSVGYSGQRWNAASETSGHHHAGAGGAV